MAAPATPEIKTDVSFSNAETGRMPTPNKINLLLERAVVQPGVIANRPPTSGVGTGDYLLVQKADGLLYKVPGTSIGGGTQGPKGDPGPPNVLTVSSTTTGAPGSAAAVSISGTSPAQSLAFTIPTGQTGPASTVPGPPGSPGPTGQPAWTLVTIAPFTVPPYGQTVTVQVADTSWIAVGEWVYSEDANGIGTAGTFQVQSKTSSTVTLYNISPPPVPSAGYVFGEVPGGSIDGVNKIYTSAFPYTPNQLLVFLNGLRQARASDYSETTSTSFSFINAPLPGDSLSIDYIPR